MKGRTSWTSELVIGHCGGCHPKKAVENKPCPTVRKHVLNFLEVKHSSTAQDQRNILLTTIQALGSRLYKGMRKTLLRHAKSVHEDLSSLHSAGTNTSFSSSNFANDPS